ncbi:MAG: exosortase B [Gallionellaceae bacterium]|nr:exosortase B [Gallionellaceae bacterium]
MNSATSTLPSKRGLGQINTWWPVLLGLAVLYLPTWWDLAHGLWSSEEQAHGPIILIVSLYLIWQQRAALIPLESRGSNLESRGLNLDSCDSNLESAPKPILGWSLLVLGLLLYALGRSQEILLFEVGSQIPVLLGVLLITLGGAAARAFWFPILFLVFMIPLPGFLVDALTGPLKQFVSVVAENVLYAVGYPVGRSGVIINIGPYQLMVADACSGLHSIFSLSALGLLYLHLMRHASLLRNGILLASIVPIAIAANVIRVILLILITYHLGDEAGQGFAHQLAGLVLFMAALLFLIGLDGVLGLVMKTGTRGKDQGARSGHGPV